MKLAHICLLLAVACLVASCSQSVYVYGGKGKGKDRTMVIREKRSGNKEVAVRPLQVLIKTEFPPKTLEEGEYDLTIDNAKPTDTIAIGTHRLRIVKPAYRTVRTTFTVNTTNPPDAPYILQRILIPKDRRVKYKITNSETGVPIKPDEVLFSGLAVSDGGMLKPGVHRLVINKDGFNSITETVTVAPKESIYVLARKMTPAKVNVRLRFDITDKDTGEQLTADSIVLKGQAVHDGSIVEPGKYSLVIKKDKYKTYSADVNIPKVALYTIKAQLERVPPDTLIIRFEIEGDFPSGVPIVPDTILLDGKVVQDGDAVTVGQHSIVIRKRAYEPHESEFNIPEGQDEYIYKAILTSLPRVVRLNLKYDVSPPSGYGNPEVILEGYGRPVTITGGEKVKPGSYELSISQEAYNDVHDRIKIFPDESPYIIERLLEAKPVQIKAEVTFDIEPPAELDPHTIHFVDEKNHLRVVKPGGMIKPGEYRYEVVKPGYAMRGGKQRIWIQPSEEPFQIRARMEALPRGISINAVYNIELIKPKEILINGNTVGPDDKFRPGSYKIIVRFEDFKDVERQVEIPPGAGRYIFNCTNDLEKKE